MSWPLAYRLALCATVGASLGCLAYWLCHPKYHLPDDKLRVFVSERCGISVALAAQIIGDSELQEDFVPLLVDLEKSQSDSDFRAETCDLNWRELVTRRPWFGLLGKDWACERLFEYAHGFAADNFVALPGISNNMGPLSPEAEAAALSARGLARVGGWVVDTTEVDAAREQWDTLVDDRQRAAPESAFGIGY